MNVAKYGLLIASLVVTSTASASFWGKVKNQFNDCKYSDAERSIVYRSEASFIPKLAENFQGAFDESDLYRKPWMRDFKYVIVINKAEKGPNAQTLRMYQYGSMIHKAKVSTGRENFELRRKNKECTGAPPKSYWSQTPTGYYTPKFLSKDHKSSSWDSSMPWAVFYDVDNGLALHEVYRKYEDYLGSRASGGCTRQDAASAEAIFKRIEETEGATVPEIREDGTPVLNADGSVKYINKQVWTSKLNGRSTTFNTYSALIIIEDVSY